MLQLGSGEPMIERPMIERCPAMPKTYDCLASQAAMGFWGNIKRPLSLRPRQ